jgi:hypothetical protein
MDLMTKPRQGLGLIESPNSLLYPTLPSNARHIQNLTLRRQHRVEPYSSSQVEEII